MNGEIMLVPKGATWPHSLPIWPPPGAESALFYTDIPSSATTWHGAIAWQTPTIVYQTYTTKCQLKLVGSKYAEGSPDALTVRVYWSPLGTAHGSLTEVFSDTVIPPAAGYSNVLATIDLTPYVTEDNVYQLWIDVESDSGDATPTQAAVWFTTAELTIETPEPPPAESDATIKVGDTSTAFGLLTETTVPYAAPNSLSISYQGPASFTWEGIPEDHLDADDLVGQRVQFEHDGSVRFRGRVEKVEGTGNVRGDGYVVTCTDFRGRARNVVVEKDPANHPSFPERIYNAETTDGDYSRCAGTGMTVGEIIKDLIDTHKTRLAAEDALYSTASADMYVQSELDQLTYVPPKVAFRETKFEDAVTRVLATMGKSWALFVDPVDGKWHCYNIRDGGTATDIEIDTDDQVQDAISQSVDGCYTAVTLFGAIGAGEKIEKAKIGFGTDGSGQTLGGLEKKWDTSLEPENSGDWDLSKSLGERDYGTVTSHSSGGGTCTITMTGKDWDADFWIDGKIKFPKLGKTEYTITDSTATQIEFSYSVEPDITDGSESFVLSLETDYSYVFRRFKITESTARDIMEGGTYSDEDCCPRLFVYGFYQNDPTQGLLSKQLVPVRIIDKDETDGPYILTQWPIYAKNPVSLEYELRDNFSFIYCYRTDSGGTEVTARYPASGYTGTAYSAKGIEREKVIIVEEFNDESETADFTALAQELLKPYKDVRAWGNVRKHDIDYTFASLYILANVKREGETAKVTGATVTTVTYDYGALATRVDLTNDFRDGWGYSEIMDRLVKQAKVDGDIYDSNRDSEWIQCAKGGKAREPSFEGEEPISEQLEKPIDDPDWGNFNVKDKVTRCDSVTYDENGNLKDIANGATGKYLFKCQDNRGGQDYVDPQTGMSYSGAVHGITLRSGKSAGGVNYANTHLLFPYVCTGGNPTSTHGECTGQMCDLELMIPIKVDDDNMTMADFLPVFLRAYANLITFMTQGMSCLDDRLFILDQNLWGDADAAGTGCEPKNLVEQLCAKTYSCAEYLAQCIFKLEDKLQWAPLAASCAGGTGVAPIGQIPFEKAPSLLFNYKGCSVCKKGEETDQCCPDVQF